METIELPLMQRKVVPLKHHKRWTKQDEELLLSLKRQQKSFEAIADILQRDRNAVEQRHNVLCARLLGKATRTRRKPRKKPTNLYKVFGIAGALLGAAAAIIFTWH
jgi:hypothetical protein